MEKRQSTGNTYVDLLRNSGKTADVKIVLPQKRQVVEDQRHRCFICHKALSEGMCFFRELHGPDPKTSIPSFGLRALCASCYFDVNQGKKPEIKPLANEQKSKEEKKAALKKDSGWDFR